MFHFFHIVFDVLKSQMGAAYVEHAVQTFLFLFGEAQLAAIRSNKHVFSATLSTIARRM